MARRSVVLGRYRHRRRPTRSAGRAHPGRCRRNEGGFGDGEPKRRDHRGYTGRKAMAEPRKAGMKVVLLEALDRVIRDGAKSHAGRAAERLAPAGRVGYACGHGFAVLILSTICKKLEPLLTAFLARTGLSRRALDASVIVTASRYRFSSLRRVAAMAECDGSVDNHCPHPAGANAP